MLAFVHAYLAVMAAQLVTLVSAQGAPGGGGGGVGGLVALFVELIIETGVYPYVLGFIVFCCCVCCFCGACTPVPQPSAEEYVKAGSGSMTLPSGIWRGYYRQFGCQHNLCDFTFAFVLDGQRVTGNGVDDVGRYTINGIFGGNRVAFCKQYEHSSPAADGRVNHAMNKGHAVEYRGEMVGHSLGQGIKGEWYIHQASSGYTGNGSFHLWPAMPDWQLQVFRPSAPPILDVMSTPAAVAPVQFQVTTNNICVVCFENPIDVCLQPCGHVAVCRSCASRLEPQSCPICRSSINSICNHSGNPFATASAPPMEMPLVASNV